MKEQIKCIHIPLQKTLAAFNNTLRNSISAHGIFDNLNNAFCLMKNLIEGEIPYLTLARRIMARESMPIFLPSGIKMRLPHGVLSAIDTCVEHTVCKYFVCGKVIESENLSHCNYDALTLSDVRMIESGLFIQLFIGKSSSCQDSSHLCWWSTKSRLCSLRAMLGLISKPVIVISL